MAMPKTNNIANDNYFLQQEIQFLNYFFCDYTYNRTVSHLLHGDLTYAVQTLLTISEPQMGLEPTHITLRTVIALPFETYCGYKLDFHQLLHLT